MLRQCARQISKANPTLHWRKSNLTNKYIVLSTLVEGVHTTESDVVHDPPCFYYIHKVLLLESRVYTISIAQVSF